MCVHACACACMCVWRGRERERDDSLSRYGGEIMLTTKVCSKCFKEEQEEKPHQFQQNDAEL